MRARFQLSLQQFFVSGVVGLCVLLGLLYFVMVRGSSVSVLQAANVSREAEARTAQSQVTMYLNGARRVATDFQTALRRGVVSASDLPDVSGSAGGVEAELYEMLLDNPYLTEVTFIYARARRSAGRGGPPLWDHDGDVVLATRGRGQLALCRETPSTALDVPSEAEGTAPITLWTHQVDGRWVTDVRRRRDDVSLTGGPFVRLSANVEDPTETPTFTTPASQSFFGKPLWSDLHEFDLNLPQSISPPRLVVTIQQAVVDQHGDFAGVIRAGLQGSELDRIVSRPSGDPHYVFLCDRNGALVTQLPDAEAARKNLGAKALAPDDDGDFRVKPAFVPAAVGAALRDGRLSSLDEQHGMTNFTVDVDGETYLATFSPLRGTQDWIVGVVVPASFYLRALTPVRKQMLTSALAVIAAIVIGGALLVRGVRRSLGAIQRETDKMRNFDFSASVPSSPFRDVQAVMSNLERAKTAMRALGKYVPVGLVRSLYHDGLEPALGGELCEVTLMFSDIRDFTGTAEGLSADELARVLGTYLAAMTSAIHGCGGSIDKFIGDSVMALWNTPTACPQHALMACRAALACQAATAALYRSPEWHGPPWVTRFGVHTDTVMSGHFGAPDRMSFTVLGDGVNLASRLEGLNKVYGTAIMVSEGVAALAGHEMKFRKLDRVSVKGKQNAVTVYELLGRADEPHPADAYVDAYERALTHYMNGDLSAAMALLETQCADPPSAHLLKRCRQLQSTGLPQDWDGVYVATSK